jgi:mRNA interferase MazF
MRPAVVLAEAGRDDWILCQITSNPYGDTRSISLDAHDFSQGGLRVLSYARPGKLFTASQSLIAETVGQLNQLAINSLLGAVIRLLQENLVK